MSASRGSHSALLSQSTGGAIKITSTIEASLCKTSSRRHGARKKIFAGLKAAVMRAVKLLARSSASSNSKHNGSRSCQQQIQNNFEAFCTGSVR